MKTLAKPRLRRPAAGLATAIAMEGAHATRHLTRDERLRDTDHSKHDKREGEKLASPFP
jgi:hypothetical protein